MDENELHNLLLYHFEKYPQMQAADILKLLYQSEFGCGHMISDETISLNLLPLFCVIDGLIQRKDRVIVAIDGSSAAGKSTLAAILKSVYDCNVFSMDDFFLRPCQRTPERLAEPGGNVDYERFGKEVLEPLSAGKPFAYRPYDCSAQELTEEVTASPHRLSIVEGVYSLHPNLSGAYDLKVFLKLDAVEQSRRLLERNKEMYNRFVREWIPMEEQYFNFFQIQSQCDLTFMIKREKR